MHGEHTPLAKVNPFWQVIEFAPLEQVEAVDGHGRQPTPLASGTEKYPELQVKYVVELLQVAAPGPHEL